MRAAIPIGLLAWFGAHISSTFGQGRSGYVGGGGVEMSGVSAADTDGQTESGGKDRLQRGAIGVPSIVMTGMAAFAPAFAIVLLFQLTVQEAGVTAPLVFVVACLVVLMLAASISQLYKAFPSAGGFFTHVSRTLNARAGFIVGWIMSIYIPPAGILVVAFTAHAVLQPQISASYGVNIPWWAYVLVISAFVFFLSYRGIVISQESIVLLGALEILIVLALATSGLTSPGPGGFNLVPFSPSHAPSLQGLYIGVVFSIFVFTGWEGLPSLAEETKNPRRNVLVGTVGAIAIWGVLLVFCTWAFLVGAGTNTTNAIIKAGTLPPIDLAHRMWGGAWVILLFGILNSAVAVSVATTNCSTRMWYGMARTGVLPRVLAKLHPKYKTPIGAIVLEIVVSAVALGVAAWGGPENTFAVYSLQLTFGLIIVYCLLNIGVFRYYVLGAGRSSYNVFLHIVFPVLSSIALIWVGYKSIVPLPPAPAKYAPLVAGGWLAIGLVILAVMRLRGREAWLEQAGETMDESPEPGSRGLAPISPSPEPAGETI